MEDAEDTSNTNDDNELQSESHDTSDKETTQGYNSCSSEQDNDLEIPVDVMAELSADEQVHRKIYVLQLKKLNIIIVQYSYYLI